MVRRTKTPKIVEAVHTTQELCGAPFDPADPNSPRCLRPKDAHAGLRHKTVGSDGKLLEWGAAP